MHRVLLLGAGKIGRMIARLLVDAGDYEVVVGDSSPAALERIASRVGVKTARIDVEASEALADDIPGLGILNVVSADRLHADWRRRSQDSHAAALLHSLVPQAALVTVCDAHPLTLSWLGAVRGQRVAALGVETFGQSADIPDLFRAMRMDAEAILDACAAALLRR